MPVETNFAEVAESTPAVVIRAEGMSEQQRNEWLRTGELPIQEPPEPKEEPKESEVETEVEKDAEAEPEKEDAKSESQTDDKPKGRQDRNLGQRFEETRQRAVTAEKLAQEKEAENQRLKTELEELRKGEKKNPEPPAAVKNDKPEDEAEAKATDDPEPSEPEVPVEDNFETEELFEAAQKQYVADHKQYVKDQIQWGVREGLRAAEAKRVAAENETQIKRQNEAKEQSWKDQCNAAMKRHADFGEVAFAKSGEDKSGNVQFRTPMNRVTDEYIPKSEIGAELLYYLGSHLDEAKRISEISDAHLCLREVVKLEDRLAAEIAKESEPPKKVVKTADRPAAPRRTQRATDDVDVPHELAGRSAGSHTNAAEEALKRGDKEGYRRLTTAAELAELKRKRGTNT